MRVSALLDELADLVHDRLWGGVDLLDQGTEMFAIFRFQIELLLCDICDKRGILHGRVEGITEHSYAVRRKIWWRHKGAADALPGVEEFDQLLFLGVTREIRDERDALQARVGLRTAMKQHVDLFRVDPIRPFADHAIEAFADAVDFIAFHGEENVGRGGKSRNELELRAHETIECFRIGVGAGADAGVSDDQFLLLQVLEGLHLGPGHRDADVGFHRRRSDPGDLEGVKSCTCRAGQWSKRGIARDQAKHRAILWRDCVDMVGRVETAATRHVLRDDGWIARQVLADVTGHDAAPAVIAAAGPEADDHRHSLAGQGWSLCGRRRAGRCQDRDESGEAAPERANQPTRKCAGKYPKKCPENAALDWGRL